MPRFVHVGSAFAMTLIAVMAFVVNLQAQSPGTAFTYQGELANGGVPITSSCNFEFKLFDAATGGAQVGPTQPKPAVAVANGIFSVALDFGAGSFTGTHALAFHCRAMHW